MYTDNLLTARTILKSLLWVSSTVVGYREEKLNTINHFAIASGTIFLYF